MKEKVETDTMVQSPPEANVVIEAAAFVENYLKEGLDVDNSYHNWFYTKEVRESAVEIAREMNKSAEEIEILELAALFAFTGFVERYDEAQEVSIGIARNYLQKQGVDQKKIDQVVRSIKATAKEATPETDLEMIIADAVEIGLGKNKFGRRMRRLRYELEQLKGERKTELAWYNDYLTELQQHQYHTDAAAQLYGDRRDKNIKKLRRKIRKISTENTLSENKGARMIFKTALRNHIDLTAIADQKANMMLSINAIVVTIAMPLFAAYIYDNIYLLVPATFLILTCGATIVMATFATRPIKMPGKTEINSLPSGETNLFFFGNFFNMSKNTYKDSIKDVVREQQLLDDSIINDLYGLGEALGAKYRRLRTCYNVFAIGVIFTLLSFIISFLIAGQELFW